MGDPTHEEVFAAIYDRPGCDGDADGNVHVDDEGNQLNCRDVALPVVDWCNHCLATVAVDGWRDAEEELASVGNALGRWKPVVDSLDVAAHGLVNTLQEARAEVARLSVECPEPGDCWHCSRDHVMQAERQATQRPDAEGGQGTMTRRYAFLSRFDILDEQTGQLYLRRWRIIQTPWFAIYLHKIAMPDKDRHLHDHPWPFVSVVLWGGYDEFLHGDAWLAPWDDAFKYHVLRKRRWLSLGLRRSTDAHRIVRLHRSPTWTLVLTGRRARDWGFYTDEGFVPWRRYLGLPEDDGGAA